MTCVVSPLLTVMHVVTLLGLRGVNSEPILGPPEVLVVALAVELLIVSLVIVLVVTLVVVFVFSIRAKLVLLVAMHVK